MWFCLCTTMAASLLSQVHHSASTLWPLPHTTLSLCSPTDLSELLKEGTKESHDRAENTQFVKDFLKGRIKRELFKVCLANPFWDPNMECLSPPLPAPPLFTSSICAWREVV